jgi:hypothetical protein
MKLNYIPLLAATALFCAACSNSDDEETFAESSYSDTAVQFTASTRTEAADGSSATVNTLSAGSTVRIRRDDEDVYYNYTSDAAGKLTPADETFVTWYKSGEKTMTISACSPATDGSADGPTATHFTLPDDQSEGVACADFATYQGVVSRPTTSHLGESDYNDVSFTLQRRLSKVNISVNSVAEKYANCKFRIKVFSQRSEVTVGTIDTDLDAASELCGFGQSADDLVTYTPKNGASLLVTPENAEVSKGSGTASAIVTPSWSDATAKFIEVQVLSADGETVVGTPMYIMGMPALDAAYSYSYKINVQDDRVYIDSVQVTSWKDGGEIEADEYAQLASPIKYSDGVLIVPLDELTDVSDADIRAEVASYLTKYPDLTLKVTGTVGNRSIISSWFNGDNSSYLAVKYLDLTELSGLSYVPKYTFKNNSDIISITLSDELVFCQVYAFYNCRALQSISAPSLSYTEDMFIEGCSNLKSLYLPNLSWTSNMFGHTADYTKCALTTRYIDSYIYEWVYTNVDEACNRQGLGPIEITLSVDDPLLVDDPQPKEILLVDFINTTTSAIVSYINSSKGSNDYLKYINIDDETIKELYSQCEMLGDLDTYRMSIESYIGMLGIVVSYYTFGSIKYPY